MIRINMLTLIVMMLSIFGLKAQQDGEAVKASMTGVLPAPRIVPSIAQQIKDGTFVGVDPNEAQRPGPPKKRGANSTVPGKGLPVDRDPLVDHQRAARKMPGSVPSLIFDANISNFTPSDPTGAVGPNHFVGAWNVGFRIFDKQGNPLTPAASLGTLFPGNTLGDPIVLYDVEADRFIITEFDNSPNGFNVAISQGPDPVNDGWYIYTSGFTSGSFPDYPKFSIWSDGYYITANISASNRIFVIERDEALQGNPAQFVGFPLPGLTTSGFYSPQVFNVTNGDLPPVGNASVVYMQDDAWSGINEDHLKIWTINVDWENTSNSTISTAQQIITEPFVSVFDGGSFSNRPQPSGPDQDVLQATIMNQAQYRRFPTYNSVVFNFVVDTEPGSGELAGIRWYELRQDADGEPWEIYQEGTYVSPYNNKDAFSGSMAMDVNGNIGMGYTTVSSQERIAIYYTGRYATDPLGQMTIDETLIAQSTTNNPSNRLADYVHLTVDPVNEKTFWHIAEYFNSGSRTDVVGVFQIAPDLDNDMGMLSIDQPVDGALTANEEITITVFNFGINEQMNIPVSYSINGGSEVNELIPGPVPSAGSVQYTFQTTADLSTEGQTYTIEVNVSLAGDEFANNDVASKNVTHLYSNDIGVSAIVKPVSSSNLTGAEEIEVVVSNFGTAPKSDFTVSYDLDGMVVTETIAGPLEQGASLNYTFAATGDFTEIGSYLLKSYTSFPGDAQIQNDTVVATIIKNTCQPGADCSYGDGLRRFKLGTIDNVTECSPDGYGDYTELSTELQRNSTHELTLTTGYGNQYVRVWIDFNDNFVYELDELVVDNEIIAPGQGSGTFTKVIPIALAEDAPLGLHMMRAKTNWNEAVPDDACEGTEYGETEDYMVDITLYTTADEIAFAGSGLTIKPYGNKQYAVELTTREVAETLIFNVFNTLGHKLVENRVDQAGGVYSYSLDMSYAAPGVYFVRFGNSAFGKVGRIVIP
jgi:hypothetical protein